MFANPTFAKRFSLVAALATLLVAATAYALKPIENIEDSPIAGNPSLQAVKKAILQAGSRRNWAMKEIGRGHIRAMRSARGHTARVDIHFSRTKYSITYHSSDKLKYKEGGLIHKRYNAWVRNLNSDIQSALFTITG